MNSARSQPLPIGSGRSGRRRRAHGTTRRMLFRSDSRLLRIAYPGQRQLTTRVLAMLVLVLLVLVTAAACGPKQPPAPPPSGPPTGSDPSSPPTQEPGPSDPSRPTLTAAAGALDARDPAAFLATLSTPMREAIGSAVDLSGSGVAQLAAALRDARLVAEYDSVRVYETTVDGEAFTIWAVKEGDQWLLAGL